MNVEFVTYFDSHFAAPGIAMIRSLFQWDSSARMTVLCLDHKIEGILKTEFDDSVRTLDCETLAEYEPRLKPLRTSREPWEFYATQKPVVIAWVMDHSAPDAIVSFVDADLFFYSDPTPVYEGFAGYSVAVSPHRFNAETQGGAMHGIYNAGFGIWRKDSIGRQCINNWARQCLDWCFRSVEPDGRFMNQGYLNEWPSRYDRVSIIQHPGANLAPWNVGSHRLANGANGVEVDSSPLVFFHFSNLAIDSKGVWNTCYDFQAMRQEVVMKNIYAPYIDMLEEVSARLEKNHGIRGLGSVRQPDPNGGRLDFPKPGLIARLMQKFRS